MKLIKSLKLTMIITFGLIVAAILLLIFNRFKFNVDYSNVVELDIKFSKAIELTIVMDTLEKVKSFERIEKIGDGHFRVTYLQLSDGDKQKIDTEVRKIEDFNNFATIEKKNVNLDINWQALIIYFFIFSIILILIFYRLLLGVKESKNRNGIALATFLQICLLVLLNAGIFNLLGQVKPLTQELIIVAIFVMLAGLILSTITIVRFNQFLIDKSQKNFDKVLIDFAEKYDENYVVQVLLVLLLVFPFVLASRDGLYIFVIMIGMVLSNVYVQTYAIVHFYAFWRLLINKLPIVKNLKWVRN